VHTQLQQRDIIAGLDLGRISPLSNLNCRDLLLLAVTEQHTRQDLDRLVQALSAFQP
jgi:glycine dehydrogenase subunit 1